MPNHHPDVDTTFTALADPTRRAVIDALGMGPATVSQLARPFAMALPSFTQHLGVLEDAGLIATHKKGRSRVCALNPDTLRQAEDWLAAHRRACEERLDRFEAHLALSAKESPDDDTHN